jgi:hypothetical protein
MKTAQQIARQIVDAHNARAKLSKSNLLNVWENYLDHDDHDRVLTPGGSLTPFGIEVDMAICDLLRDKTINI